MRVYMNRQATYNSLQGIVTITQEVVCRLQDVCRNLGI